VTDAELRKLAAIADDMMTHAQKIRERPPLSPRMAQAAEIFAHDLERYAKLLSVALDECCAVTSGGRG
jgi:hypothetical protein